MAKRKSLLLLNEKNENDAALKWFNEDRNKRYAWFDHFSCHISSISGLKSGDQWLLFSRQSLFASTNTLTYTSLNNTVYIKHLLSILPLSLQGAMPLEHLWQIRHAQKTEVILNHSPTAQLSLFYLKIISRKSLQGLPLTASKFTT